MFESIVVRRTNGPGTGSPVDLGHLAETMIFYSKVHFALSRGSLRQLIIDVGPETAVRIVEEPLINAIFLDRDYGIRTEKPQTGPSTVYPVSFNVTREHLINGKVTHRPESAHDIVYDLFQEALPVKPRKANKLANRFLDNFHTHNLPESLPELVVQDWQDQNYLQTSFTEAIKDMGPGYQMSAPVKVELEQQPDHGFIVHSNIDWARLSQAYASAYGSNAPLTPGDILVYILEVREDLHLGAAFESSMAQDPLGSRLMRAKCGDLTGGQDSREERIRKFQEVVVSGVSDVRKVINSGACSFSEFLDLLERADSFRDWLAGQQPDANLIKEYYARSLTPRFFQASGVKTLRWVLPALGETAVMIARALGLEIPLDVDLAVTSSLAAYDAIDGTLLHRLSEGWQPSSFIDTELRPFVASAVSQ